MKVNYQLVLDGYLDEIAKMDKKPSLLLHSCCGPCSSYVLEYLNKYFSITVFYYNPNIYPHEEFLYRAGEQEDLISKMNLEVGFISTYHNEEDFYQIAKGLENEPETGVRCHNCYRLRLEETAKYGEKNNFDYFTTTLSISPHKNSQVLNQIGEDLERIYDIKYLYSDFKKKDGYKRSVELSKVYDMYRQEYCGCVFSLRDLEKRKKDSLSS